MGWFFLAIKHFSKKYNLSATVSVISRPIRYSYSSSPSAREGAFYTNFVTGEPDMVTRNTRACVMMDFEGTPGGYEDEDCATELNFVCQRGTELRMIIDPLGKPIVKAGIGHYLHT